MTCHRPDRGEIVRLSAVVAGASLVPLAPFPGGRTVRPAFNSCP
jgi:hypothetical protein